MTDMVRELQAGQYHTVIEKADKILETEPDNEKALLYKAIALKKTGRLKDALETYDKALMLDPDNADLWFNRGICIRDMNDRRMHKEASRSYEMAVRSDPSCRDAFWNQGNVSSRLAEGSPNEEEAEFWFEKSFRAYNSALKLGPDSAALHCCFADLYVKQKKMELAVRETEIAENLDGGYQPLFFIRGYAYMSLYRWTEAIEAFDHCIQADPESEWSMRSLINKGICQYDNGDPEAALKSFNQAGEMDPPGFEEFVNLSKSNAFYNIAYVKKQMGDMDACAAALKQSFEYDYRFQMEHWLYEPRKEITGPSAWSREHIT